MVKPDTPVTSQEFGEAPAAPGPHYSGHRGRLKAKFERSGGDALPDYELLELVLFRSIPRRDTKPVAKALLTTFGSFAEVIGAPVDRLMEVEGIGRAAAMDLKLVQESARRIARGAISERPLLSSWSNVIDYCRTAMGFETVEQFRVLFLDKRNTLIADEVQQRGTIDHTPVYPRQVVKRALELSATAIILVHNHPSGDVTPSKADQAMTRKIVDVAESLGISVHDHLIVSRNAHTSFRAMKLL